MLRICEEKEHPSLYDVACRIYDANMMLRAIAELDEFQDNRRRVNLPCWHFHRNYARLESQDDD